MIGYLAIILISFTLTFLVTIPFIKLLYKYNIRRVSKAELDALLPGKQVKFGTPIMGGAVIVFAVLVFSFLWLRDWDYYLTVVLITIIGAIFGAIDEYTNTLGRTFKAIRISLGSNRKSLFPVPSFLYPIKKVLLVPWNLFEESIRIMGSEQRGMKAHYKFLMQIALGLIPVIALYLNGNGATVTFPIYGTFTLTWWIYGPLLVLYFIIFANAFGITDGLDGLSAGTHSIAFALYGMLASYFGYTELAVLAFLIVGAELAFLYFNIHPARMEMSDVGTMPLGTLFALMPILLHKEFSIVFIGAIFLIEIGSSFLQVWSVKLRQKRVFLIAPIHHHFEKLGWPETKVTMRFWLFTLLSGLVGLLLALI